MDDARDREPWLPDLCRLPRLAMLFAVAELVVLVVALAPSGEAWNAGQFASASCFALWLALSIAVLLCAAREPLSRLPRALGGVAAVACALLVALVGAALVHQFDGALGYGLVPSKVGLGKFAGASAAIAALITAVVLRYFYVIDGWQAQVRASAQAQADALQARIRPHFLFNSINAIVGIVRRDPALAEHALLDLSDLFRAALGAGEAGSSLGEEVELAERYLAIERLRLGSRLQVDWTKREPLPWDLPLPRLVLQPLVENAVLHGVARLPQGGTVAIELACDGELLRIRVGNPVPERDGARAGHEGARHAQRSIGDRLAHAFGPRAGLTVERQPGYYQCELRVPT